MTFSYILTQSSSSKGDQYEKKMATAILLFFKKRKYHHNRELSSTSARYIFKKKTPRGLIEETKHPIKPVFSHHFNSFRAVFSSSSDSFLYTHGHYGNNGFLRVCAHIVLCPTIK